MFIIVNNGAWSRIHAPTWIAAAVTYGSWAALTIHHQRIPLPVLAVLGAIVIALHGSLQHETIHGHPAGPRWIGRLLGEPALSLWLPYEIYRDTHRRHHLTSHLTDPAHDPEAPSLRGCQRTALGRLTLGPLFAISVFVYDEARALVRGTAGHRRAWFLHAFSVALVVWWLIAIAHMPLWKYVLAFVYPGTSLTLLRSFAEHRADALPARRTTVVEAGLFFRLLFLNNNFHVAHHAAPKAPWFELPRIWAAQRAEFVRQAPDLVHPGYGALVRERLIVGNRE